MDAPLQPAAEFEPVDLLNCSERRPLPFITVGNLLPETTSTGEPFLELLIQPMEGSSPERRRAARSHLLHECLGAGLSRHETVSAVWASGAASDLRGPGDDMAALWPELEEVEDADPAHSAPLMMPDGTPSLLTESERSTAETVPWWGVRYLDLAEATAPVGDAPYNRLNRWLLLAGVFTDIGVIPKRGTDLRLRLPSIVLGGRHSGIVATKGPLNAVARNLATDILFGDISEQVKASPSKDATHFEGRISDGVRAARAWGAEVSGRFIWAIDHGNSASTGSLVEDQQVGDDASAYGAMPSRLAMELADARDKLMAALGATPVPMLMERGALDRHSELKLTLNDIFTSNGINAHSRDSLFDFADSVRICATLVAMSEGSPTVTIEHELVAIHQSEEWLANLIWVMDHIENPFSAPTGALWKPGR